MASTKWLFHPLSPGRIGIWTRTNNKLWTHIWHLTPGIKPVPRWWEASTLTSSPSLLPSLATVKDDCNIKVPPEGVASGCSSKTKLFMSCKILGKSHKSCLYTVGYFLAKPSQIFYLKESHGLMHRKGTILCTLSGSFDASQSLVFGPPTTPVYWNSSYL